MSKSKKKKNLKQEITSRLRAVLGENATRQLLEEFAPDLLEQLKKGDSVPKIADLLARKIIRFGIDPKKPNQWAVELICDRLEGKAAQGEPVKDTGRILEGQLDAITVQHLNALAAEQTRSRREAEPAVKDETPGHVPSPMEMLENGTFNTEEDIRQLDMAENATQPSR